MTDAELSILLTDDQTIQGLNREWRGRDRPTDVLSFSQVEGPPAPGPAAGPAGRGRAGAEAHTPAADLPPGVVLGDVVISLETAARQAAASNHGLDQELARLLVHGVLHLLGHDHVRGGSTARRMKAEERRLLQLLERED